MNFTIDLDGARSDTLEEYVPPASETPARKRLYFFWRGLLGLLQKLYEHMEPYMDFASTTGFADEEEAALFREMVVLRRALAAAANWAAIQYGDCELLEGDEPLDAHT